MRLVSVRIQNYRSCQDITLELGSIHALVGANNAGKSTVLRALDFLFNPSIKTLNEESFWNKDTSLEIRVEALFSDLSNEEKEALKGCLKPDSTFHMARSAKSGTSDGGDESDAEAGESKIAIGQHYKKPIPTLKWLQESEISGKTIAEWWKIKDELVVEGVGFAAGMTKKPTVEEWKTKATEFIAANATTIPMQEAWVDNPRGYANVLKRTLPFFVLVPAVRDVTDESKGTKSSPFGKLLYAILDNVAEDKKAKIDGILGEVAKQMNRTGGNERVLLIADTEKRLNSLLGEFFGGCDLEIEFATPTLEVLLTAPKLYVDDGFRNAVENKGHGLQRAVIFSILRCYADHMTSAPNGRKRNLILAVEEPELYMHPQAQRTIRRVFRKLASGSDQVLFSTHSSLLVDVEYFDEIIRMETECQNLNGRRTTVSRAWQLPITKMIEDLETRKPTLKGRVTADSMRDRYSHVYNPHRNEGFFASKIILVEGLTEEYSLPIYADAMHDCAFDPLGISVVECGGKGAMDRLFRVFNELHIPCYILFDYDKENRDPSITDKSKELLALAGKPQTPPASLFVDDAVACFPNNWESDLRAEIPDIDRMTAEARKELGISTDSGKPLIARYVARKSTSASPPAVPASLKTIIEKAIAVVWTKSCLQKAAADPVATMGAQEKITE